MVAALEPSGPARIAHGGFGEAEVQDLHDAVRRDLDVRRLQVPMNDVLLVRRIECVGDLPGDGESVGNPA